MNGGRGLNSSQTPALKVLVIKLIKVKLSVSLGLSITLLCIDACMFNVPDCDVCHVVILHCSCVT